MEESKLIDTLETYQWAQRSRGAVAFVDPALLAFILLFYLVFSFGRACAVSPSVDRNVVSGGCYINIAGRKPISRKRWGTYQSGALLNQDACRV